MVLYELSDADLLGARKRAIQLGTLRNSFMRGRGNEIGMQGEYAVADHVSAVAEHDTYDYDLLSPGGVRIEVKSKSTTRKDAPEMHYMASVATANTKQDCDIYFFTRVIITKSKFPTGHVWVMGFIPRAEFYDKAIFYEKGQKDPDNGYKVHQDCWNIAIGELYQWNDVSEKDIVKLRG